MEKENKFKKISSVVPDENDFVDAILSLMEHQKPHRVCMIKDIKEIRWPSVFMVMSAEKSFSDMFSKVLDEFPGLNKVDPLYASILHQRYNMHHYARCLDEVFYAREMIDNISSVYRQLLKKDDDCVSLDQFKSLKVAALACMFTVAKSCIPSLAYLEMVRQYMANLEDDAATWKNKCHALAREHDLPVFQHVYVDNIADFVDPNTLFWL